MDHPTHNPNLFRGKYRIPSARRPGWDYATAGWYFVTICTKYRLCWFGEIRSGTMGLSDIGCIVANCWEQIPLHHPRVVPDAFIIMPNHVHGIVRIIDSPAIAHVHTPQIWTPNGRTPHGETPHAASLQGNASLSGGNDWKSGCLGAIINQCKSACTKRIHEFGCIDFAWQPRFHDHIIRNDSELLRIRRYIQTELLQFPMTSPGELAA
ncbi:transposase [Candidatus Peregrinibacteria bacterium]|nr:transposase [Candidatus Peregrinibacteria bacterium]